MSRVDELSQLILRLQRQDESALEPFIQRTQDRAWRLAYSLLQDRYQCEDVLQDVYLTVYRSIGSLREPAAFHSWFFRIVTNKCKRVLRAQRPTSLDEVEERPAPPVLEEVPAQLEVRAALRSLSETDREVLALREAWSLSYDEIADFLRVPLTTVKSRLFKARQRLLEILGGQR